MRHYIYRVVDKTTGEFYWGVRSCKCDPKDDTYTGSMKAWKPDRANLVKNFIKEYSTRELANNAEHIVLKYFIDKKRFPLNRNYAINDKFCMFGRKQTLSRATRDKIGLLWLGKKRGKYKPRTKPTKGHPCSRETRDRIGLALKGKTKSV